MKLPKSFYYFVILVFCSNFLVSKIYSQTRIPYGWFGPPTAYFMQSIPPFQNTLGSTRKQFLYLASQLQKQGMTAGYIDSLGFRIGQYSFPSGSFRVSQLSMKIGHTTYSDLTNVWLPTEKVVFGPEDYYPTDIFVNNGVNMLNLTSPFYWNGVDNILLDICDYRDDYLNNNGIAALMTQAPNISTKHDYRVKRNLDPVENACGSNLPVQDTLYRRVLPVTFFSWRKKIAVDLIDPNPSIVQIDGSLKSDLSYLVKTNLVKGAATDGLSKVVLYADWPNPVKIKITTPGNNGKLSSFSNQNIDTTELTVQPNNGKIAAIYRAPDGFGDAPTGAVRTINLDIEDLTNNKITKIELQLHTPPVVLVHGMWSGPNAWEEGGFTKALSGRGFPKIFLADYERNNYKTFNSNNIVESGYGIRAVAKAVRDGMMYYKKQLKIAVSQVDIVGHSLGGLMARSYSQTSLTGIENYYKGYIHKLITLSTPHRGSPFGPLLWEKRKDKIASIMSFAEKRIGSCHEDFGINSPGLGHLTTTLPFKTFAVTADATGQTKGHFLINSLCLAAFGKTLNAVMSPKLFPCASPLLNDLIVPMSSQRGFDGNNGKEKNFINTAHSGPANTTVTNSWEVQKLVVALLLSNKANDFGTGFPSADSRVTDCNTQALKAEFTNPTKTFSPNSLAIVSNKAIKINTAIRNQIFNQGDSITLEFRPKNGAQPTNSIFMVGDVGWYSVPDTAPYLVNFVLPKNKDIGKIPVLALSTDITGIMLSDTCYIFINPVGTLDSISVNPAPVYLDSLESQTSLTVMGYFISGSDTSVSKIGDAVLGTTYTTLKTNIINITGDGIVTAVSEGSDTILVQNGNKVVRVPVVVNSISPYTTVKSGNWLDPSVWTSGIIPYINNVATILPGHKVLSPTQNWQVKGINIEQDGELEVADVRRTFTVGDITNKSVQLTCKGKLSITGGKINLYGNLKLTSGSNFNMTLGSLIIDGNSGQSITSIPNTRNLFDANPEMESFNFKGGTLQFIDPPFGDSSQTINCSFDFGDSTTTVFGNGISIINSNNPNGFGGNLMPAKTGKIILDAVTGSNNRIFKIVKPIRVKHQFYVQTGRVVQVARVQILK